MQHSGIAQIFTCTHSSLQHFSVFSCYLVVSQFVESDCASDSMAKNQSCDPLFGKVLESPSKEAQRNLTNSGLLDPGVLVCYLDGPDTEIEELAREPGDIVKLQELLRHARRAARGQRAEFAPRGLDEFVRRDKERKEEARAHETKGPTDLQRSAEGPPP